MSSFWSLTHQLGWDILVVVAEWKDAIGFAVRKIGFVLCLVSIISKTWSLGWFGVWLGWFFNKFLMCLCTLSSTLMVFMLVTCFLRDKRNRSLSSHFLLPCPPLYPANCKHWVQWLTDMPVPYSKFHLPWEGTKNVANPCWDCQWHLLTGTQPSGWKLTGLFCVTVSSRCSRGMSSNYSQLSASFFSAVLLCTIRHSFLTRQRCFDVFTLA